MDYPGHKMLTRILLFASSLLLLACAGSGVPVSAQDSAPAAPKIPEPDTWKFPDIMEDARKVSSLSIEGKPFNRYGLPYSLEELKQLDVRNMEAAELQKYADVITHAYPDALGRQIARECGDTDIDELSNQSIVGVAYVSLNAIDAGIREQATACLSRIQNP